MLARLSRRLSVLTPARLGGLLLPALLGGLLWMGLPGAAEAGDWKHGRRHGHGYAKHDRHHYRHHGDYEHRGKSHHDYRGYSRGWSRHRGKWYGRHVGHRHHHHGYPYRAPVAVGIFLDGHCGHAYESWDLFSHHVHHHHGVSFVDLPGLLVQTNFGFVFHR